MDESTRDAIDRHNAECAVRRAREIYAKADAALDDPTLPETVCTALRSAKTFGALACMEFGAGDWAGCSTVEGFAREAWKEAQRLWLVPVATHGQAFIDGPKKERHDALTPVIDKVLDASPHASAKDLLRKIAEMAGRGVIQSVDDDGTICWRAGPLDERDTSFHAFEKRLSKRRKKISARQIPPSD